jgi:hypothetical protein
MNIDDPIRAAEAQVAADERQSSAINALMVRLAAAIHIKYADKIAAVLDSRRAENRQYLFDVLLEEFKKSEAKINEIAATHRRFLEGEYLDLVMDGFRKAENIRAKKRIARLGQILASVAEIGPDVPLDGAEELMRIAVNLSDLDVAVLREIHRAQGKFLKDNQAGRVNRESANEAWHNSPPRIDKVSEGDIQSCCATLQSFGLIARVERSEFKLGPNEIPYALLRRGAVFVEFIRNS